VGLKRFDKDFQVRKSQIYSSSPTSGTSMICRTTRL
jgi:hypothetical protein